MRYEKKDAKNEKAEKPNTNASRRVHLPDDVNLDSVSASLTDGILTVTIEKKKAAQPRAISIN